MGGLGGGGATIIQAGSHSTFFVTLGLAFCQPICGPHLCHPEYKTHPFIYRLLVFFCSVVLDSYTLAHFEFKVMGSHSVCTRCSGTRMPRSLSLMPRFVLITPPAPISFPTLFAFCGM